MIINQRNNESYGPHSAMSVGQVKGNGPTTSGSATGNVTRWFLISGPSPIPDTWGLRAIQRFARLFSYDNEKKTHAPFAYERQAP